MKKIILFLLSVMMISSTLELSACSNTPETLPTPRLVYTCPRVVQYSHEQLNVALGEYLSLVQKYPVSAQLISDYLGLRDSALACQRDAANALSVQDTKK